MSNTSIQSMSATPFELKILELINEHRQQLALEPLVMNDYAHRLAELHTQKMASGDIAIGHDGFINADGSGRAADVIRALGGSTAAENVAYGQTTPEDVVQNWLTSDGHRQNIEGTYNVTGISVQTDAQGRHVFTQIFVYVPPVVAEDETPTDAELAEDILSMLNEYRQSLHLPDFQLIDELQTVAETHSARMAAKQIALGYDGLRDVLNPVVLRLGGKALAANIAQGKPIAEKIVESWLQNDKLRTQLEANFTHTGIGSAHNAQGDYFITQILIRK